MKKEIIPTEKKQKKERKGNCSILCHDIVFVCSDKNFQHIRELFLSQQLYVTTNPRQKLRLK